MTSEALVRYVMNDRKLHDSVVFAVNRLRHISDTAARDVAKQNAAWRDDPQAEDYEEFHATAWVQFPRAMRDEAIHDLVAHYLTEAALSETAKGGDA